MIESDLEIGDDRELEQTSVTAATIQDSTETRDSSVGGHIDDSSTGPNEDMSKQVTEPDTSVSLNENSESTVETEHNSQGIMIDPQRKSRHSSFFLTSFPGRRNSMSPLILILSRSLHFQTQHQCVAPQPLSEGGDATNISKTDSLEPQDGDDMDSMNFADQEQLINQNKGEPAPVGTDSYRSEFRAKLKKLKHSTILSLKNLKYFIM